MKTQIRPPRTRAVLRQLRKGLAHLLLVWCGAFAAALLLAPVDARAQAAPPPPPSGLEGNWQERVRLFTVEAMQSQPVMRTPSGAPLSPPSKASGPAPKASGPRLNIEVGAVDPRLRLAPCARMEPYLPAGARLSGATRIGMRCTEGANWNISVPVRIQAFGRGLVALSNVAQGTVMSAQDVATGEIDLLVDPSPPLLDPAQVEGRTLARGLSMNQSVRQSHIKARQWFAAGDTVKVLAGGSGFSVSSQGQALTPGIEGQPARVRTETGRVITGMPVGDKEVAIDL